MLITNIRLDAPPVQKAPVPNQSPPRNNEQGRFDRIMQEASRRQDQPVERDRPNRQRDPEFADQQAVASDRPAGEVVVEEPVTVVDECAPIEEIVTDEAVSDAPVVIVPELEFDIPLLESALSGLAAVVELPVQDMVEWLVEEEIPLEELPHPENIHKFIEYSLGEKTPAELLTDPVVPEIHKAIAEAIKLAEATPEAVVVKDAPVVAESQKQQLPVIHAKLENLEVEEQDGEIVVTDEVSDEMSVTEPSKQQQGDRQDSRQADEQPQAETAELSLQAQTTPLETSILNETQPVAAIQETQAVDTAQQAQVAKAQTTGQSPVNAQDVINQIMAQVKVTSSGENFTEMRLMLRPESLGEITLRVITQNGIVMAQFEAESQRVKEVLEANFNQLRDALTEAGIAFGQLNVYVRQEGEERFHQFERERQANRRKMEEMTAEEAVDDNRDLLHNGILDVVV